MSAVDRDIEALALQLWREREMKFPAYCRRMDPDEVDRTTDAWAGMLYRAERMTMGGTERQTVSPISTALGAGGLVFGYLVGTILISLALDVLSERAAPHPHTPSCSDTCIG